jgi:excisionase family DNA binding protein
MTERRLLTRPEAAKLLNLSLSAVEKMKDIPHVKLGRRAVRYDSADLWAWIETKKTGGGLASAMPAEVNFEPQKAR